ncbi:MAG: transporter substrate-binding domain-containing protein [Phycisphaerales bacterium]
MRIPIGPMTLAIALLAASLTHTPALAARQQPEPSEPEILRVVPNIAPPFNSIGEDDQWRGLTIHLLEQVSEDLGFEYTITERTIPDMLADLESGSADLAVAALTVTPERERRVDFCHPYLVSGLAIAAPAGDRSSLIVAVLGALLSPEFLQAIGALGILLLAVGIIVWCFERKKNAAHFGGSPVDGVAKGFWFSAVTMTTVGYGDKAPTTLPGRIVTFIWMFASVIIISSFTAAIASALTVDSLGASIRGPEDLIGKRIAVVEGSTSEQYAVSIGASPVLFDNAIEATEAVADGRADAAVNDRPILGHIAATRFPDQVVLLPGTLDRQDYAFAVPSESDLRDPINQAILEQINAPEWDAIRVRFLGR